MKIIEILRGLLVTQLNHLIIFIIGITVFGVAGTGELYTSQLILLGLLPFAFYLIRYFSNSILVFAVLHVMTAAIAAFLLIMPHLVSIIPVFVFSLIIAGYLVLSFVVRLIKKDKLEGQIHYLISIIIFLQIMLLQQFHGVDGLNRYYIVALIFYIGLYLINMYFINFSTFISRIDGVAESVAKRLILKNGIKLVFLFTVAVVIVITLLTQISIPSVSLPARSTTEEQLDDIFALPVPEPERELPPEDSYNPKALSSFWVYAGPVINILIITVISVFGIVMLFRFFNKSGIIAVGWKEQDTDLEADIHEKVGVIKPKSEARTLFRFFSPRERIRRIFKKRVLEGKSILIGDRDRGFLSMFTAHECRTALGSKIPASIYDKARYSNLECTTQDVKACKTKR